MSRWQKVGLAVLGTLVVLAAAFAIVARPLFTEPRDWSKVVSIETAPEYQDAALLERAWALPVASTYRSGLDFQSNGSFCGPASVVNVARSIGLTTTQEAVLEGSGFSTLFGMLPGGITLDQLALVAQKRTGKQVTVLRDLSLASFREHLERSNDLANRYIANFSRAPLFGRGGGHHSPIGGYLKEEDLVFVVDVNATYKPWLVKSARLFEAVNTVDRATKKRRGLLLLH